ncbi:deoxyribodipyrimidine photolyase [Massilia eurypsychrophila]|uniref:Deoxyribodipyrimidine photolyase n=1 Tax=Massilia eurypsychrophila TaxID=1485217 RepID=A0A2G8TJC5_9BURK|nr:deoxyribodipyrimidine photo-lyase [Massilia eurypsychrophila]PIL46156.1 deoxyribodipyrimidine photolyase [Massilia eurypsychrophila]
MTPNTTLVWFRRDLRAFDHAALHHALLSSRTVYCAFIFDDDILAPLPRRDRRVEFIHASVAELDAELHQLGGHLIVRRGPALETIAALACELDADAVFANEDYEPQATSRDAGVAAALARDGRQFRSFKDQVIFEKNEVLTLAGQPFSVFTPYKNAWIKRMAAEPQSLAPWPIEPHAARLAPAPTGHALPSLADIGFEPTNLRALGITPGMAGGAALLEDFIGRIADYNDTRNYPAVKGPSYLSVHLRFGTVSIRHLVRTVNQLVAAGAGGAGAPVWLSELIWREFYAMILFQHPRVVTQAFKPAFDAIGWEAGPQAEEAFAAWCEGRTGYPLVDAAMVQLNQTGYQHNRLRMVTASFLVKDLGIDWRWGERYFALQLNDYDLASNNGGWQWAASTGCDAQPWFRIFNPITQSEKFDPQGRFIRRYLPQLAGMNDKQIHAPWLAAQRPAGYPAPIVDHAEARARTLARFAVVKQEPKAVEPGAGAPGQD